MIRTLEAERAGFDFSLVDESLGYSYEQRARYHQAALNLAREMENAGRRVRDRHQPTAQRLCDADIDFVIVGGFAATLHGSSLVTRDLDVCAILSSENVANLRDALRLNVRCPLIPLRNRPHYRLPL
jgi:hypothetical protein